MANPHPHVAWRDGRPRFTPGSQLRAEGLVGTNLRWPTFIPDGWAIDQLRPGDKNEGRWFTRGEAVDWSAAFVKARARQRAKSRATVRAKPRVAKRQATVKMVRVYTVADLFDEWQRSSKFQLPPDAAERRRRRAAKVIYSEKTIADYRKKASVIERHDPSLWAAPVDAITQPVLFGLYEELIQANGLASARGAITVLGIAMGWGKRRGKVTFRENMGVNPARDLGMTMPPPRVRFGTRTEIETLVTVADHIGWSDLGDMIMLGVWTGQRQSDRLQLVDYGLIKGRRIFRQSKTGAIVAVLEAPELERRLAGAAERRRPAKAEALLAAKASERADIEARFRYVILNEMADPRIGRDGRVPWRPYRGEHYAHRFAVLRSYAVAGILDVAATAACGRAVWIVRPCKSLDDFRDQDLRDTAVTWMALAGCTIPEIISVTGHSPQSATQILKHYLAVHPEMADAAIGKMVRWFDAGGETEFGF